VVGIVIILQLIRTPCTHVKTAITRTTTWAFSFLKGQPILSIISLIVSVLFPLLTVYLTFFRHPEALDVYFRFNDPAQVGTSTLDLGYFFSNDGSKSYMIEKVGIYELWLKSPEPISLLHPPSQTTTSDLSICEDKSIFPLKSLVLAMAPPSERRHHWTLQNGGNMAVLEPTRIYIDGVEAKFASTIVEPGKTKSIIATFTTDPLDKQNYNIVVICPAVRFFNSTGHPLVAICKGWQSTVIEGQGHGYFFTVPPDTAQLIPSPRSCAIESDF
jgi:hypothetical protein